MTDPEYEQVWQQANDLAVRIDQLKTALGKVLKCGYKMQDPRAGWRFSFRIDNKMFDEWKEMIDA